MSDRESCQWCGEQLTEEEIEYPHKDNGGDLICDSCYQDHFEFACCRCGEYEHVDYQHVFCAVFEPVDGLDSKVFPGIYEIVRFPYYAYGMIEGYVYNTSLRRVRDIEFERQYDSYPMGHLCRECRRNLKLRQSKLGRELQNRSMATRQDVAK